MNDQMMLNSLKIDLGITTTHYDSRLQQYLTAAEAAIAEEGITIDSTSIADCNLIVLYAAYLWRKRDTAEGMPRYLRWMLNNRLFGEKVNA